MTYTRHSSLHGAHTHLKPTWGTRESMPIPTRFKGEDFGSAAKEAIVIADVSFLRKMSVKGPGADEWLRNQGVEPPETPFEVAPQIDAGGIIARIGRSEYFLEAAAGDTSSFFTQDHAPTPTAHPTSRHDASLLAVGPRVPEVIAQTCGVDIVRELPGRIVLTRMAAVNAMLLYRPGAATLRIWCDPSFGVYLYEALVDIAQDLGGAPAGLDAVHQLL